LKIGLFYRKTMTVANKFNFRKQKFCKAFSDPKKTAEIFFIIIAILYFPNMQRTLKIITFTSQPPIIKTSIPVCSRHHYFQSAMHYYCRSKLAD
jgi:hypothetical protein